MDENDEYPDSRVKRIRDCLKRPAPAKGYQSFHDDEVEEMVDILDYLFGELKRTQDHRIKQSRTLQDHQEHIGWLKVEIENLQTQLSETINKEE